MEITANELAQLVNGTVDGDGNLRVHTFAKIEEALPGSLTFLANPKYTHFIYDTEASIALVRKDFKPERQLPEHLALIRVDDPYSTLAALMRYVEGLQTAPSGMEQPCYVAPGVKIPEEAYVGAFAYIGTGSQLGKRVKIYPQVYIGEGVKIGEGTILYAGAKVYSGCEIGNNCIIHSGAVIGADGFGFAPTEHGYEKIPQMGKVVIGDEVEIGANTCIDRATMGQTTVGKGTKIDNLVQVAHNVCIGKDNVFAAQGGIAGSTMIGDQNMIGGQVGFAGHITIGSRNQIGAQSGIPNSIGNDRKLMGYPAVDRLQFARTQVYLKRLEGLFNKK